jgi:hypothetical protein
MVNTAPSLGSLKWADVSHLKSDNSTIPLGPVKEMDAEGLEVFEGVKHEILHKVTSLNRPSAKVKADDRHFQIWALHKEDSLHDLNEIRQLDHVKFYKPLAYRVQEMPYGASHTL